MKGTAENLDADYHMLASAEALAFLVDHTGGVGLGQIGPRNGAVSLAREVELVGLLSPPKGSGRW